MKTKYRIGELDLTQCTFTIKYAKQKLMIRMHCCQVCKSIATDEAEMRYAPTLWYVLHWIYIFMHYYILHMYIFMQHAPTLYYVLHWTLCTTVCNIIVHCKIKDVHV